MKKRINIKKYILNKMHKINCSVRRSLHLNPYVIFS